MKTYSTENCQNILQTLTREVICELVGAGIEGSTTNYSVAHIKILPGGLTPKHFHPVVEETYCVIKGRSLLTLNGEEAEVGPGEVIQIAPPQHHKMVNPFQKDLEMLVICVPAWTLDCTVSLEEWRDGQLVSLESES